MLPHVAYTSSLRAPISVRSRSASSSASNGFLNVSLIAERSKLIELPSSGSRAIRIVSANSALLPQVLADLQGLDLADREIDDDAVGMEALGLNAGFETAGGHADFELPFDRQLALQVLDQDLVLADDQHLGHRLVFEVAQRHAVLFEELDQILAGDATVLRAGDAVALEPAGIEPLADRAGGHFTDLRDLSSCEDLHRRLSSSLSFCRCRFVRGEEPRYVAGAPICICAGVSILLAGSGSSPGQMQILGRGGTSFLWVLARLQLLLRPGPLQTTSAAGASG